MTAASERRPSVLLGGDHAAMDELLERFRATPAHERALRRERFSSFAHELRSHIAIEEDLLFPRMEAEDPSQHPVVARLLEEHGAIRACLDGIERQLTEPAPDVDALEWELRNVLGEHNAREEGAVYPWFDGHLAPEERERLAAELEKGHGSPPEGSSPGGAPGHSGSG